MLLKKVVYKGLRIGWHLNRDERKRQSTVYEFREVTEAIDRSRKALLAIMQF